MTKLLMAHPTQVLLEAYGREPDSAFMLGRLSMALEVITSIRCIEGVPVVDEHTKSSVVSALETLLVRTNTADIGYEWYERLLQWRRLTFVPVDEHGALLHESAYADEPQAEPPDEPSSPDDDPPSTPSRVAKTRALLQEHRDQGALTSDEIGESLASEDEARSSEESTSPPPTETS